MNDNIKLKTIVTTDIVDFTVKSSILPYNEISKLLQKHDDIIKQAKNFDGDIVKNVGDGYLILFPTATNALDFVKDIMLKFDEYNKTVTESLYKLEIRVAVVVGEVLEKKVLTGIDYFSESINLAYRILSITPGNTVYIGESVYYLVDKGKFVLHSIGYKKFKGIGDKVKIYVFDYKNEYNEKWIKKVNDSKNIMKIQELEQKIEEINKFIFQVSSVSAVLVTQPIPLLDLSSVFFLQVYMAVEIAKKYGLNVSKKMAYSLISSLIGTLGFEYTKSWAQVQVVKVGLLGFGGYVQAPLAFSLVYSFGKLLSYKFYYEYLGEEINFKNIKNFFLSHKKDGYYLAKEKKEEIIEVGKKIKNNLLEKIKNVKTNG